MSYWVKRFNEIVEEQKRKETPLALEGIPGLTLAEFTRRDMAVLIYSEVLKCELWLCSNDEMAAQVKRDAPGAVCYTVDELRHLLSLDPSPESLKKIHEAKAVFPGATVVKSGPKGTMLDQALSEIDNECPSGLYTWLAENDPDLDAQITEAEGRVNQAYKDGSLEELKAALEAYAEIHKEAAKKMKKENLTVHAVPPP